MRKVYECVKCNNKRFIKKEYEQLIYEEGVFRRGFVLSVDLHCSECDELATNLYGFKGVPKYEEVF